MGATCYANAVIQCFRHCPKIPWMFESSRMKQLFKDAANASAERLLQQGLCESFADIIQLLQSCKRGQSVRPADFWTKFRKGVENTGFEQLAMKMPHDSHEFYLCLLDMVHESMSQQVEMKILRPEAKTDEERRCIQALEAWRSEFEKKYSPIVDLFYGLTHITVECSGCKTKTHRWETFTTLKATMVDGAGTASLGEMLREEFKPETIPGYDCDKCRPTRHDAVKTTAIWRLPLYLVLVLRRFTMTGGKIGRPVEEIKGTVNFQEFFSKESPEYEGSLGYTLNAIVDHHGPAGGGHYTAQTRTPETNNWVLYDDENTHPLEKPMFGGSTYMLWFERIKE